MRHLLHLAFRGTDYHGWQTQAGGLPTVQSTLEAALTAALGEGVHAIGCGRTDAGVHAHNYYAHFDLRQNQTLRPDLVRRLNHLLPEDICIYACRPVPATWHAQRSATFRRYAYTIDLYKNPFHAGTSANAYERDLDLAAMQAAVGLYAEASDFRAFCRRPEQYPHTRCRIDACTLEVLPQGDAVPLRQAIFHIQADRFLQNMVRLLVARLLEVGRGVVTLDELRASLEAGTPTRFQTPAWAGGLSLVAVGYPAALNSQA